MGRSYEVYFQAFKGIHGPLELRDELIPPAITGYARTFEDAWNSRITDLQDEF